MLDVLRFFRLQWPKTHRTLYPQPGIGSNCPKVSPSAGVGCFPRCPFRYSVKYWWSQATSPVLAVTQVNAGSLEIWRASKCASSRHLVLTTDWSLFIPKKCYFIRDAFLLNFYSLETVAWIWSQSLDTKSDFHRICMHHFWLPAVWSLSKLFCSMIC